MFKLASYYDFDSVPYREGISFLSPEQRLIKEQARLVASPIINSPTAQARRGSALTPQGQQQMHDLEQQAILANLLEAQQYQENPSNSPLEPGILSYSEMSQPSQGNNTLSYDPVDELFTPLGQAVPVQAEEIANYLEKVDSEQNYPNTPPPSVAPAIRRFNPNIDAPILAPAPITENGVLSDTSQPVAEQTMVAAATAADEAAASTPGTRNSKSIGATSAIASASPKTGNARGSQMGYGFRPGDLMRIGMAIMGGAGQGFGAAMGAGSQALGQVQNEIRDEQAAAEQLARLEEQQQAEREQELMLAQYRAQRTGGGAGGIGGASGTGGITDNVTRRRIEQDQERIENGLRNLLEIERYWSEASKDGDPLLLSNRVGDFINSGLDHLGIANADQLDRIERVDAFKSSSRQALNDYIKAITGAAMSLPEAERIKGAMPHPGLSPARFRSRLQTMMKDLRAISARHKALLRGEITTQGSGDDIMFVDTDGNYVDYTNYYDTAPSTPAAPAQSSAPAADLVYDPGTDTFVAAE